jgi:membrane protein required for colicin V production
MAAVFLLVYLAVSFVTSSLQKNVKSGEDVTVIDRTLGFVFGLVRGLVLLGLLVLVIEKHHAGRQSDLADRRAHFIRWPSQRPTSPDARA